MSEKWKPSDFGRYRETTNADIGYSGFCLDCGSLVVDFKIHDAFHDILDKVIPSNTTTQAG